MAADAGPDLCTSSSCDPDCPQGMTAPPYYVDDGTAPCTTVGKVCTYFESGLSCLCDHHWWYTDCGTAPCKAPDAGFPTCATDAGAPDL